MSAGEPPDEGAEEQAEVSQRDVPETTRQDQGEDDQSVPGGDDGSKDLGSGAWDSWTKCVVPVLRAVVAVIPLLRMNNTSFTVAGSSAKRGAF